MEGHETQIVRQSVPHALEGIISSLKAMNETTVVSGWDNGMLRINIVD